jgi:hypothetical protein
MMLGKIRSRVCQQVIFAHALLAVHDGAKCQKEKLVYSVKE